MCLNGFLICIMSFLSLSPFYFHKLNLKYQIHMIKSMTRSVYYHYGYYCYLNFPKSLCRELFNMLKLKGEGRRKGPGRISCFGVRASLTSRTSNSFWKKQKQKKQTKANLSNYLLGLFLYQLHVCIHELLYLIFY